MQSPAGNNHKQVYILLLILFVCLLPSVSAHLIYRYGNLDSKPTKQKGILISPAIAASSLPIAALNNNELNLTNKSKHWDIIFVAPQECDQTCLDAKKELENLKLALGRDYHQVSLTTSSIPELQKLGVKPSYGDIYIKDPYGFIMMRYDKNIHTTPDILKDLRHLIRYSHASSQ